MDHFLLQAEWLKHLRALSYPAGATPCKAAANGSLAAALNQPLAVDLGECGRRAQG
jgi:hypothetical protein